MNASDPLTVRVRRGIALGLVFATTLSVAELLPCHATWCPVRGPVLPHIGIYFSGFAVGGALAGLLGRLLRSPFGALLIGFVTFFPMLELYALTQVSMSASGTVVAAAGLASLVGGPLGLWFWSRSA